MATKTITTKVDDIDGSPAAATLTFTWQGYKYHIDLSVAHAEEMKADFDKWVVAARRDRGTPGRTPRAFRPVAIEFSDAPKAAEKSAGRGQKAPAAGPSTADIRAWANEQGIAVASRGRIAPTIIEQYLAANPAF